jgi:hypothetical protein
VHQAKPQGQIKELTAEFLAQAAKPQVLVTTLYELKTGVLSLILWIFLVISTWPLAQWPLLIVRPSEERNQAMELVSACGIALSLLLRSRC